MVENSLLKTGLQSELEDCVQQFENGWTPNRFLQAESWLSDLTGPARSETLAEIIRVDMELRWDRGEPEDLDFYVRQFPELSQSADKLSEIAWEDYRLRSSLADPAFQSASHQVWQPEEYANRYSIDVSSWPTGAVAWEDRDSSSVRNPQLAVKKPVLPKVGDRFCGFRLIGLLGTGGCGSVFLARQGDLANRLVSLKVTTQQSQESLFLARLQHSNIVPVFSVHHEADCNAICMPFLGLATLKDVIAAAWQYDAPSRESRSCEALLSTVNQNRFDCVLDTIPDDQEKDGFSQTVGTALPPYDGVGNSPRNWSGGVTEMAAHIAEGLAHAHEKGVVHGDIKPANILMTDDGQPVLLDFHLSRLTSTDHVDRQWIGGTLPYMSPQQLQGFLSGGTGVDTRSDVYSAGVVLYELFTGQLPWPVPDAGNLKTTIPGIVLQRLNAQHKSTSG